MATVLPQEPRRVTWVCVMLSPTVQGCPGILCMADAQRVGQSRRGWLSSLASAHMRRGGCDLKLCVVLGQDAAWMMTLQDFFQGWPAAGAQPWP